VYAVKYAELQQIENAALEVIRREGVFHLLPSLNTAAHQAQILQHPKQRVDFNLSFTLPSRLREDSGGKAIERSFHVGCLAVGDGKGEEIKQLSYSVLIGLEALPDTKVARKLHFDFEPIGARNQAEEKPTFHMQICGKLSPHHASQGYRDEHIAHMLPSWSKPRIPTPPMSLALILNWLFIEFGTEAHIHQIRQNIKWRKLVRDAERKVLLPYYKRCADFLSSTANEQESFYAVQLYESKKS
jgi:hypothetical protein